MRVSIVTAALLTTSALCMAHDGQDRRAENKRLIADIFKAMEVGDLDTLNRGFDPEGQAIIGTETRKRGGPFKTFVEAAPFPGSLGSRKITIEEMIAEEDKVAIRSEICGTHERALLGFQPTGKRLCARYINFYTIEKGRVVVNAVGTNPMQLIRALEANAKS